MPKIKTIIEGTFRIEEIDDEALVKENPMKKEEFEEDIRNLLTDGLEESDDSDEEQGTAKVTVKVTNVKEEKIA